MEKHTSFRSMENKVLEINISKPYAITFNIGICYFIETAVESLQAEKKYRQVRKLLADKNLEEIQFSVRFVDQITPDQHTGKKPLIIRRMEDMKNDKDKHYRKAI